MAVSHIGRRCWFFQNCDFRTVVTVGTSDKPARVTKSQVIKSHPTTTSQILSPASYMTISCIWSNFMKFVLHWLNCRTSHSTKWILQLKQSRRNCFHWCSFFSLRAGFYEGNGMKPGSSERYKDIAVTFRIDNDRSSTLYWRKFFSILLFCK